MRVFNQLPCHPPTVPYQAEPSNLLQWYSHSKNFSSMSHLGCSLMSLPRVVNTQEVTGWRWMDNSFSCLDQTHHINRVSRLSRIWLMYSTL